MGLLSLGAGDFTLGGLITFKICHRPSCELAVVTETAHQLKFLQLSNHGSSYCSLSKAHDHVVITLPAPDKKCRMNSSPRGVPAV